MSKQKEAKHYAKDKRGYKRKWKPKGNKVKVDTSIRIYVHTTIPSQRKGVL